MCGRKIIVNSNERLMAARNLSLNFIEQLRPKFAEIKKCYYFTAVCTSQLNLLSLMVTVGTHHPLHPFSGAPLMGKVTGRSRASGLAAFTLRRTLAFILHEKKEREL